MDTVFLIPATSVQGLKKKGQNKAICQKFDYIQAPAATTATESLLREWQLERNIKARTYIFILSKNECIFPYCMW